MSEEPSIHFTGPWTKDEQQHIKAAVWSVERDQPFDPIGAMLGCAWICTRVFLNSHIHYMAHWSRRPGMIFKAASAVDLAGQIQNAVQPDLSLKSTPS